MTTWQLVVLVGAVLAAPSPARAGPGVESPDTRAEDGQPRTKWMERFAPRPMTAELGLYGGLLFPSSRHALFDETAVTGRPEFDAVAPELGVRLGFYPSRHFGIEGEGSASPVRAGGDRTALLLPRAHLVAQIGLWSLTPFVLFGGGGIGVDSSASELGNDTDPILHFGGGLKFHLSEWVALRLDIRDNISRSCDVCTGTGDELTENGLSAHHPEVLLGLSMTLPIEVEKKPQTKPKPKPPPPPPKPPKDTDGDGILDVSDRCVTVPETFNEFQDEDGCPEYDKDGDGFWNIPDQDACPDVPGVAPDGCPANLDTDGDGFLDPVDGCVTEPEIFNGYKDKDGCPDEIPPEIVKFTGVIEGIYFDSNKDRVKPKSEGVLQSAIEVFQEYRSIRIKISGHTDIRGSHDHNMDLSRRRAASVKGWLVDHGMDASRLVTEGYGPDEPIADNKSKAGRSRNRRIEFEIIKQ